MEKSPTREDSIKSEAIEEELNWISAVRLVFAERITILLVILCFFLAATAYSLTLNNIYRAQATLVPAESSNSSGALTSQLGAAATLVGIEIDNGNTRVSNALAILRSREFAVQFIKKHDLLAQLMTSSWDSNAGQFAIDPEKFDVDSKTWIGEMPTDWQIYQVFSKILTVSENRQNGLIGISIDWFNPDQAAEWVNWLVHDINEHVKARDLREAENAIEFLTRQLSSTQLLELQRVFYQLIESQTRTVMLADVREEYVFQIIDPATAPAVPISPKRLLIISVGISIGIIFAVSFVIIRRYLIRDILAQLKLPIKD